MALADTATAARRAPKAPSARHGGWLAEISTAPQSASDPLKLVIESLSGQHQWATTYWEPNAAGDLPLVGDTGIAIVDEHAGIHLVKWYPAT